MVDGSANELEEVEGITDLVGTGSIRRYQDMQY
jgi:hypothetical protein